MSTQLTWTDAVRRWVEHHDAANPRPVAERLAEQEATIQRLIAQAAEMGREIERLRALLAREEAERDNFAVEVGRLRDALRHVMDVGDRTAVRVAYRALGDSAEWEPA